jgi:hypothetical protein
MFLRCLSRKTKGAVFEAAVTEKKLRFSLHVSFPVRVAMSSRTWLREQETSWYREGMHALVSRWRKAVDVDGYYVEK